MRWVLVLVAAILPACAAPEITEVRVRDPWQIAVENVTAAGTSSRLPASAREHGRGCEVRDDEGFPHFCAAGDFLRDRKLTGTELRSGTDAAYLTWPRLLVTAPDRATLAKCACVWPS